LPTSDLAVPPHGDHTYELPGLEPLESEISNVESLHWLLADQLTHDLSANTVCKSFQIE